ncbi:hypothetical protein [Mongoliimonas terrestris]|uniref:hypothetical protein n=1 Tax=Mongoliimonas terrestris TaxID=1709001 RepID=UPI000949B129|nr:hypothetical protein [Mongoliimonas terrestris]
MIHGLDPMRGGAAPFGADHRRAAAGRSVGANGAAADSRANDQRSQTPAGRALVPAGPRVSHGAPAPAHRDTAAPYLVQLIAGQMVEGETGERRHRRDPRAVAPRAVVAYRAAERLGSDLEPGFLASRSA